MGAQSNNVSGINDTNDSFLDKAILLDHLRSERDEDVGPSRLSRQSLLEKLDGSQVLKESSRGLDQYRKSVIQ